MFTHVIQLKIGRDNPDKNIVVKCNDSGVNILVYLETQKKHSKWRTESKPYTPPNGCTAVLKIKKPDQKYVTSTIEVESDGLFFPVNAQAFTVAGRSAAEVSLYGVDGRRVTSSTFNIEVEKECVSGCEKDSDHFVDLVQEQVQIATEAQTAAEEAAESAEEAAGSVEETVATAQNYATSAGLSAQASKSASEEAARSAETAEQSATAASESSQAAKISAFNAETYAENAKRAAEEVEAIIAEIEVGLDGIIALQENLIGGGN